MKQENKHFQSMTLKKIRKSTSSLLNEQGFSLIEILVAVILLGVCFIFLASMMYQNNQAIKINTKKEEAAFVREDIKEWLLYKSQIQDIGNLNIFVFIESSSAFTAEQQERRNHLILDNSGVQIEAGQTKYSEIKMDASNSERGTLVKKVQYHIEETDFLPSKLQTTANQLYIGEYIDRAGQETDYLVEVVVTRKTNEANYNPRTDGVGLNILIYDKENGNLLTETYVNWVVES